MHSKHATSAAQDALDALMIKYPPRPTAITSTEVTTDPLPDNPAVQDTTLPDAPVTAPVETEGWKTVEGQATQRKMRKYTLRLVSLPTMHGVVQWCPSSYPIPRHSIASLSND
jgi:hypothetical protein